MHLANVLKPITLNSNGFIVKFVYADFHLFENKKTRFFPALLLNFER